MIFALVLFASAQALDLAPAGDIRQSLDAALKDYPSARFQEVRSFSRTTPRGGEAIVICGTVNAKNSMGGYAGWRKFLIFGHWNPAEGIWFSAPSVSIRRERGEPLGEAEFIDVLENNSRIDATCAEDADNGASIAFDPTFR